MVSNIPAKYGHLSRRSLIDLAAKSINSRSSTKSSEAIDILEQLGSRSAGKILLAFVMTSSSPRRASAVEAINSIGFLCASPYLLQLLSNSSDTLLRVSILTCLGDFEYQKAQPTVASLLKSQSELVRMYAAYALGKFGGEDSVSLLNSRLMKESSVCVQVFVKSALRRNVK